MTVVHVTAPMLAAYDHFIAVGFIENGAGAAVGNFCQESGEFLIATMFRAHPDASGGVPEALKSGGIAEWLGDRKTAYIAFEERVEKRLGVPSGSLLNDLGTQCDFVVYELQTNPRYATLYHWLTVDTGRSVATLTYNFCWIYEDPAKETANLDNRVAHAEAVVAKARLLKAPPAPQPAPPAPISPVPVPQIPVPAPMPPAPPAATPIPASWAARLAIELDQLISLQTAYRAEFPTPFDGAIAELQKLGTAPTSAFQLPAAELAVIQPQRSPIMNPLVLATVRSVLLALGGAAVSKGVVDESTMTALVGGAVSAASFAWSLWGHSKTSIIAAAASLPEVQKVVTTPAIADSPKFAANNRVVAH